MSDEKEILRYSEIQARVTHDTDEGVFSAQVVALSVHYFLYKKGPKSNLEKYLKEWIPIDWDFKWEGKVFMRGREAILAALAVIQKYDRLSTILIKSIDCLLYTSPSPRDATLSRMPSSA